MKYLSCSNSDKREIQKLFLETFTDSEGQSEGELIENLVADLMDEYDSGGIHGFVASDNGALVGGIFFTKLKFDSSIEAFLLAPVAVHTDHQQKGVGQALVDFGIDQLRQGGVKLIFTYGDPGFYSKTGFKHISENVAKAPFELSQPEGWLAQSLDGSDIKPLAGTPSCVSAFRNSQYW